MLWVHSVGASARRRYNIVHYVRPLPQHAPATTNDSGIRARHAPVLAELAHAHVLRQTGDVPVIRVIDLAGRGADTLNCTAHRSCQLCVVQISVPRATRRQQFFGNLRVGRTVPHGDDFLLSSVSSTVPDNRSVVSI